MVTIMFEEIQARCFFLALDAKMDLYANGRTTGLTCNFGQSLRTVPFFEHFSIPHAVEKSGLSGEDMDNLSVRLLQETGGPQVWFSSFGQLKALRKMREDIFFVA